MMPDGRAIVDNVRLAYLFEAMPMIIWTFLAAHLSQFETGLYPIVAVYYAASSSRGTLIGNEQNEPARLDYSTTPHCSF